MPTINVEKCYVLHVYRAITHDISLDIAAVSKAIATILTNAYDTKEFNPIEKEAYFNKKLTQFMGYSSTYNNKKKLIESFVHIQSYFLDQTISNKTKVPAAHKLYEDLESCPSGFHNRVDLIVLSLYRPQTISEFLHLQRVSIIDKIARDFSTNVHAYNAFFNYAHQLHFGIEPLCNDEHMGILSEYTKIETKRKFEARYTPMTIMNELLIQIESELREYYSYQGMKVNEGGYLYGDLERMMLFLQNMLGEQIKEQGELLICGTHNEAYDLNWQSICNILCHKLWNEAYLFFSPQEKYFFQALYHQDDSLLEQMLVRPHFRTVLLELKLFNYKHLITHVSQKKGDALIQCMFYSSFSNVEIRDFLSLLKQFENYHTDLSVIENYHHQACEKWLNDPKNFERIQTRIHNLTIEDADAHLVSYFSMDHIRRITGSINKLAMLFHFMILTNRDNAMSFLKKVLSLSLENQLTVFRMKNYKSQNILMSIALNQPTLLTQMFEALDQFSSADQMLIWTQTTNKKCNIFMLLLSENRNRNQRNSLRFDTFAQLISVLYHRTEEEQFIILNQKNSNNQYNLLMLAISVSNADVLKSIIVLISTLSEAHQYQLWSEMDDFGSNALTLIEVHQPTMLSTVLSHLIKLSFSHQVMLLKNATQATMMSSQIETEWLPHIIMLLDTASPIDREFYNLFKSMTFDATNRKRALLYALAELKIEDEQSFKKNLSVALADHHSPLCCALKVPYYFGFGFFQSDMNIKKLKKLIMKLEQAELELAQVLQVEIHVKRKPSSEDHFQSRMSRCVAN